MAHRSSAPALHSARLVLKKYTLTVKPAEELSYGTMPIPTLEATDRHMSIIIDRTTNAHELALVRPTIRYWQTRLYEDAMSVTPDQLLNFLGDVIGKLERVPQYPAESEDPAMKQTVSTNLPLQKFGPRLRMWKNMNLTKACVEATRVLFAYYTFTPRTAPPQPVELLQMQLDVALLIEVSIGLHRALRVLPLLRETKLKLTAGRATLGNITGTLRALGVLLDAMPHYEEIEEESKLLV